MKESVLRLLDSLKELFEVAMDVIVNLVAVITLIALYPFYPLILYVQIGYKYHFTQYLLQDFDNDKAYKLCYYLRISTVNGLTRSIARRWVYKIIKRYRLSINDVKEEV